MGPRLASPLRGGGGCGVHGKVPDGALLQVLLLPLGHVGLQGQDPLLLLPHEFHEGRGIVFQRAGWRAVPMFLEKQREYILMRHGGYKADHINRVCSCLRGAHRVHPGPSAFAHVTIPLSLPLQEGGPTLADPNARLPHLPNSCLNELSCNFIT